MGRGGKTIPICGFGQTILFHNCKEYVDYMAVMRNFPLMMYIEEKNYIKSRRKTGKLLHTSFSYHDNDKDGFLNYFSILNWEQLDSDEKSRHVYQHCPQCPVKHREVYAKLRRNSAAFQCVPVTHSTQTAAAVNIALTEEAKDEVIRKTVAAIGNAALENTNQAVLANNLSFRSIQQVRRSIVLEHLETPRKQSKINPEKYVFDTEAVAAAIVEQINTNEKLNWAALARTYPVFSSNGGVTHNGNQILKEFAISEGLIAGAEEGAERKKRRGKRRLTVDGISFNIADIYPTDEEIKEVTRQKITSGELDIGIPIVPITIECVRIGRYGRLESYTITTHGRAYKLQKILNKLLLDHEKKGYLREPRPETADITKVKEDLEAKGIYSNAETIEELNEQMTQRMFTIWHDHSTVASHSHFLVLLSLIYDPLVYLTPEEYGQIDETRQGDADRLISDIEKPEVYIFARSQSSVKDQMLYTPYRVEDLKSLIPSISAEGHIYKSVMRVGMGDSPARAFESGNQINGYYGCHCGIDFRHILTDRLLRRPKYISWQDRQAVVDATTRWKDRIPGQISVFDKLDAKTLRRECADRGMDVEGCDKKTLENYLSHQLCGIKRSIALLCTEGETPPDLTDYMICQLEILHDLKCIIGHIVKEMPNVVPTNIKQNLGDILPQMQNHQYEISGSNARLTLLRMRMFINSQRKADERIDTAEMKTLDHLLTSLSHIQQIAYSTERQRTPKNILAMHNLTFLFSAYYMKLFPEPKTVGKNSMFGMSFHSLVSHFAEWYRLVALRSLAAENQERYFRMIKSTTNSTNYQDDHLIVNSLIRLQAKANDGQIGSSLQIQESSISKEWSHMPPRGSTVISREIIDENPALFSAHKHRIIDYINEGMWHMEDERGWIFKDGDFDPTPTGSMIKPMHIRSHSICDVWDMLDEQFEQHNARQKTRAEAVSKDIKDEASELLSDEEGMEDHGMYSIGLAAVIDSAKGRSSAGAASTSSHDSNNDMSAMEYSPETELRAQLGLKLANEYITARQQFEIAPHSVGLHEAYKRVRAKVKPLIQETKNKILSNVYEEEKLGLLNSGSANSTSRVNVNYRLQTLRQRVKALDKYLYY